MSRGIGGPKKTKKSRKSECPISERGNYLIEAFKQACTDLIVMRNAYAPGIPKAKRTLSVRLGQLRKYISDLEAKTHGGTVQANV